MFLAFFQQHLTTIQLTSWVAISFVATIYVALYPVAYFRSKQLERSDKSSSTTPPSG